MSTWRWVAPAPIEAAHALWTLTPVTGKAWTITVGREGRDPDQFTWHLIWAIYRASEPDLLRLALAYPGYASAVMCAKDGDLDRLREAAGHYVKT